MRASGPDCTGGASDGPPDGQGHPVPLGRALDDREPGGPERVRDLALAVGEDPRRQEQAARPELVAERRGKRDQQRRDEVGEDDVERPLAARQRALPGADPAGEPVAPGVRDRRLDRDRVDVDAQDAGRAEAGRGDRQDPRAAADVEDARPVEVAALRPPPRRPPGRAGSSGGGPSRTPSPDRARGRRRPAPPDVAATSAGSRAAARSA